MMKGIDCNEKMPFCFMQEEKAWICLAFQMYDKYKNGVSGVLCIIISIVMLFSMVKVMKSDNAGDCHEKCFSLLYYRFRCMPWSGERFPWHLMSK